MKAAAEGTVQELKIDGRITLTINGVEYPFRWCPAGAFMLGNEPRHHVTFSSGFWLLETEVTQGMWESVMGNNASSSKGANLPVEMVSWYDSQEYIGKLNDLGVAPAGFKFSLPTEAQWEYACRAGTTTAYCFGDTLEHDKANFASGKTTEVGSYPANAWGLRDMHGNVWEWCLDWFWDHPSGAFIDSAEVSLDSGRVIRGGSWDDLAECCRSAYRGGIDPSIRTDSLGIRLALVRAE